MARKKRSSLSILFNKFSSKVTKVTGKPAAFILAIFVIIIWVISGPIFDFSDTWQLVINTGTTIITFLMVFVIQHSQNKDTLAIQLKLNELIAANYYASNRLVAIEDLTEEELDVIKKYYTHLAKTAKNESDIHATHSLDEAQQNTNSKTKMKSSKK
jgi:low affinity Fe/Cu permease